MLKYIKEDIKHRAGKFLFLVISVTVGIAAITGILQINSAAQEDLNKQLENFGANMVIYPKSDAFSLQYGGVNLADVDVKQSEMDESDLEKIYTIPNKENINIVSPKVVGAVYVDKKLVPVVGVNFTSEYKLKKWWNIIGEKPHKNQVLVGYNIFNQLDLGLNENIMLNGKTKTVSGFINKTETQDDRVIFMHLDEAQHLLGKEGKISLVEVMAFCHTCPIEEIIRQIEEKIPGVKGIAAKQLINAQMSMMSRFLAFGTAISIFILIISMIGLTTSMMGWVKDKTTEIGILRAVGFRKKDVGKIILAETFIIALTAGIIGYGAGQLIAIGLGKVFLDISVGIDLMMLPLAVVISLVICSLAALLPLRTASKITVVDALRSI
jgi:putative ABC transport system permease protein